MTRGGSTQPTPPVAWWPGCSPAWPNLSLSWAGSAAPPLATPAGHAARPSADPSVRQIQGRTGAPDAHQWRTGLHDRGHARRESCDRVPGARRARRRQQIGGRNRRPEAQASDNQCSTTELTTQGRTMAWISLSIATGTTIADGRLSGTAWAGTGGDVVIHQRQPKRGHHKHFGRIQFQVGSDRRTTVAIGHWLRPSSPDARVVAQIR